MDDETKRQLLKAAIGVVASSLAAVLSAVALRYIVLDKLLEGESPAISGVGAQPVAAGQLGDLNLSKYESALLADLVLPQDVDASLDDIGGLWEQIAELKERVLYPLQHPRMFAHSSVLRRPTGVLLYGPPGTGKTLLAKAIAKSTKAAFLNVNVAQLQSKWFGESPKLIAALFSLARKLSPCIIFADELDGFLSARESGGGGGQYEVTNKTQFLQCWEGLTSAGSSGDEHWVLVIGATNRPWALDPAVLRRMPRQIRVDLPDSTARADILRVLLRTEHCEPDLQLELPLIAEQAEGLSGSDLREVVREAAMVPVREALERQRQASPAPDAVLRWSGGATGTSAGRDDTDAQDSDEAQSSIDEHLEQHQDELRPISAGDLLVGLSRVRPSTDAADEYRRAASSLPGHRFGDAASGAAAAGSDIHQHGASAAPAAGRGQQHTDGCPMCASSLLHLAQHFGGGHLGGGFG